MPDTINCKVYPLAPARKLALRKWIDEEEAKGYIRKLQSPIMSSWFEIAKKTGDPRCYVTAGTFTRRGLSRLPYDKTQVQSI
jgi:hypothetical protein